MRGRTFAILFLYVASAVVTVSLPGAVASAATGTVTATPNTGLTSGDLVTVALSGFTPSVQVGVCQGIVAGAPGVEDCGGPITLHQTDGNGAFSTQLTARRFLNVGGQSIDCAATGAACMVGAAEYNDIPNTAVVTPLTFLPATSHPRPDLLFTRIDTGQQFEGNRYFNSIGEAPQHAHGIPAGGTWTYAVTLQNDGDAPDDLILTTPIVPPAPFALDVFVGYYDVSTYAAGGGVVFHNVAPGQSLTIAVRFRLAPGVQNQGVLASVKLSSLSAPELVDYTRLWVDAPIGP